jgi:hypothetical protein
MPRSFPWAVAAPAFLFCAFPVFGQAPAPGPSVAYPGQSPFTGLAIKGFRAYFVQIMEIESAADQLKAQGKDDSVLRGTIQKAATLTDRETSLLKQIAGQCNNDYDAETAQAMQAVNSLKQQNPGTTAATAPPEVTQQLAALEAKRTAIVAGCMLSLKAGMGNARFNGLSLIVLVRIGSKLKQGNLQPGATFSPAPVPNTGGTSK